MKVCSLWPYAVAVVEDLTVLIIVSFIAVVLSIAGVVACLWNVAMSRIKKAKKDQPKFVIYKDTDGGPLF